MHITTARRIVCVAGTLACAVLQFAAAEENSGKDLQQWRHVAIERATAAAGEMVDPYRRAEAFTGIARAQIVADDSHAADAAIHSALAAASQVKEPSFRDWALHDIVQAQIAADDLIGAMQTADGMTTDRPRGAALAAIANVKLRAGNFAAAQAIIPKIRNEASRSEVQREIVAMQAASDELPSARQGLKEIDDAFYQAYALGDVAVAEIRHGNLKAADALGGRARKNYRALVYSRIALARVEKGDVRGGLDTLAKIDDRLSRAVAQGRVAAARAAADTAEAQRLLADALSIVDSVTGEPYRKTVTLTQLARLQVATGDRSGAQETLRRALALSSSLKPGEQRDDALDLIARGQARSGDGDAALTTSVEVTGRIARALLVRDVVTIRTEQNEPPSSLTKFEDPLMRAAAVFGLLGAQLSRSKMSVSPETIDSAYAAVRSIQETDLKPAAFAALASAHATIGDSENGAAIFQEALAAAESVRADQRAIAYTRIVDSLNDRLLFLGQPVRGERSQEP